MTPIYNLMGLGELILSQTLKLLYEQGRKDGFVGY